MCHPHSFLTEKAGSQGYKCCHRPALELEMVELEMVELEVLELEMVELIHPGQHMPTLI